MKRRSITNTPLEVSEICLGTMTFGNPVSWDDAVRLVHYALDHGINFLDTADIYEGYDRRLGSAGGVAERILGEALRGRRDQAVITTKVGNAVGDDSYKGSGLGEAHMRHQIEVSLKRMQTDYVDVYELHKPDPDTPLERSIAVMADLIAQGKVRCWGFSNFDGTAIRQMVEICDAHHWPRPVVNQPRYSWLVRDVETDQTPLCVEHGIAITPYRGLECGLLTGKYTRQAPAPDGSRVAEQPSWMHALGGKTQIDGDIFDRLESFVSEARTANLPPAQYAVRWLLDQPAVASVLVGVKRQDQLDAFIASYS